MMNKIKSLFYIFFPLIVGGIVAFIIKPSMDYDSLTRPFLSPPAIVFPIAWSIIYLLMGISYYIYKKEYKDFNTVSIVYYLQLFVNAMWSIIFFVLKWRFFAIIWILLLLILLVTLLDLFNKTNKVSMRLNIPYLLWVMFATYLTIGIYILN